MAAVVRLFIVKAWCEQPWVGKSHLVASQRESKHMSQDAESVQQARQERLKEWKELGPKGCRRHLNVYFSGSSEKPCFFEGNTGMEVAVLSKFPGEPSVVGHL